MTWHSIRNHPEVASLGSSYETLRLWHITLRWFYPLAKPYARRNLWKMARLKIMFLWGCHTRIYWCLKSEFGFTTCDGVFVFRFACDLHACTSRLPRCLSKMPLILSRVNIIWRRSPRSCGIYHPWLKLQHHKLATTSFHKGDISLATCCKVDDSTGLLEGCSRSWYQVVFTLLVPSLVATCCKVDDSTNLLQGCSN